MSAFHRRPGFLLVVGLCIVGGAVTLLGRLAVGPQSAPSRVQLSNVAGTEACPSFAPNGRHLAYSGRGDEQDSFHIWTRALPTGAPQQLTQGPGSDICPVWSPDGASLAFLRVTDDAAEYMVMPSGGGAPRKIAATEASEDAPTVRATVSWMRDGKSLALVRKEEDRPSAIFVVPVDSGEARRVTDPPAGSPGDSSPAVSPDGGTIAFVRGARDEAGDVWRCDANGANLRQVTFDVSPTRGIAWTPDGRELVYASNRFRNNWKLWRIDAAGGSPREVVIGARVANDPAIAPSGHRLAYTQTPSQSAIWLVNLPAGDQPHTRPVIRSSGRETHPSWSPDGRQVAWVSDRSGADEVWIGDASGGGEAQVTDMKAMSLERPRWSPDGRTLLFASNGMPPSAYTVPASARMAKPKPLGLAPGAVVQDLSWSHDGKSVYGVWRGAVWKFRGEHPVQLGEQFGSSEPEESPDGKYVYFWSRRSIWRVPAAGGKEEEMVPLDRWVSSLQPVNDGVYSMTWEGRRRGAIWFYDFARQKNTEVLRLNEAEISRNANFDVSPDRKLLLYPKIARAETDLVLVDNFR